MSAADAPLNAVAEGKLKLLARSVEKLSDVIRDAAIYHVAHGTS